MGCLGYVCCLMVFGGGVACCGLRVGRYGQRGRGGNIEWGYKRAYGMVLGLCLYLVWNSLGVNIAKVALFWFGVMPYMYSLSRHCWGYAFMFVAKFVYVGLDYHFCSRGEMPSIRNERYQFLYGFRSPFLVRIGLGYG